MGLRIGKLMSAHIHDAATGETIVRELTDDELAILEKSKAEAEAEAAAVAEKATARAAALAKLGLTADEITALFG